MLKTLGWLAVGLVAGAVAVVTLRPESEIAASSSASALLTDGDTVAASEHEALVARVEDLEEKIDRLMLTIDSLGERVSDEAARTNSEDAARAAVMREIEQRLAAAQSGAPGPGPGGAPVPPGWVLPQNVLPDGTTVPGAVRMADGLTVASVAAAAATGRPLTAPPNLSGMQAEPGQTLVFRVTGANEGPVWGTDTYTDDSSIAAAAVHAGLLRPGETGTIMVTVQTGFQSYPASSRNGISSSDYGAWGRSFTILRLN